MRGRLSPLLVCVRLLLFLLLASPVCFAQFSGSIQGVVRDETGAVLPHARITLVNQSTGVTATTTSDESGNYRFVSLAPDPYKITVEASGFAKTEAEVNLLTEQNLSIPLTLKVGTATEARMPDRARAWGQTGGNGPGPIPRAVFPECARHVRSTLC